MRKVVINKRDKVSVLSSLLVRGVVMNIYCQVVASAIMKNKASSRDTDEGGFWGSQERP